MATSSNSKNGQGKRRPKRQHGYRHVNGSLHNPIRVRSKRLDEVDPEKISLAFWSLARKLAEEDEQQRRQAPEHGESEAV